VMFAPLPFPAGVFTVTVKLDEVSLVQSEVTHETTHSIRPGRFQP